MKLLIIRFSSIGDIVLTTPVVRCIKQQIPDVEVHYLTKSSFRAVVVHNPHIDKIHFLDDNLNAVIEELKKENFDYVIDLHHNLRTARVKRALGVPSFSFPKLNIQKWLLVNFKWKSIMPDKSIVERYFETVRKLGVRNDGRGLDYFIPEYANLKSSDIPMSHWSGYVACVIGGSMNTKKLPVEQWRELAASIPYPMILLGGPEDRDMGNLINEGDKVKIYNACGKFNLNESAWFVKHAKVVVSNDTGLMHVAAAYKKPIISLWGNTSPEMGMFPYYGNNNLNGVVESLSYIAENKQLSCHPCSKIGYNKCPKGHFNCMRRLIISDVSKKIQDFWQNPPTIKH